MKYVRVMDEDISNASGRKFKIGEVNISDEWDPNATTLDTIKGINFSTDESIIRWIKRGDTLYEVELPEDAEVIKCPGTFTPDGIYRTNKIIVKNPIPLTEDVVMDLYKKSNIPDKTYHDVLAILAIKGFENVCMQLIKDRVNSDTIDEFLSVDFAKLANYDRYVAYQELNNDDAETTVLYVNMDFDKEDYVDPLVIDDFDDYVLVNKHRQLSSKYVPDDLVTIDEEYVKADGEIEIERNVAKAFYDMAEDASKEGLELMVSSGYRSYEDQEEITNTYLELYGQNYVDNYVAKPGFSEHQTAMSLDIASKSVNTFVNSDEYVWMMDNAYKYGFILRYPKSKEDITGYKCEAWHYRYVGKKIAKYIKENNITYDEYYVMFLDD